MITVNDIEHIEAKSYDGVAIIKIFFQPTADIDRSQPDRLREIVAEAERARRRLQCANENESAGAPLALRFDECFLRSCRQGANPDRQAATHNAASNAADRAGRALADR